MKIHNVETEDVICSSANNLDDVVFKKVLEITKALQLSTDQVDKIQEVFSREINFGLSKYESERRRTSLPMIKTFMTEIPDGTESGYYLGVDLGGTNFRIILAELIQSGQQFFSVSEQIPADLLNLSCRNLFDYIVDKLAKFLDERNLKHLSFKLGFTFSFPTEMESMRCARLLTWTKGFNCPDGVGEDIGSLFQEAINKREDLDVELVCVVNDTTATLLAGAFSEHSCAIGIILGTGSNAAYYQDMAGMEWFLQGKYPPFSTPDQMIVDVEWGCFGDNGSLDFLKTEFDVQVDCNSVHRGSFTFEKMFSGLYYGELCRVVLLSLAKSGLFLRGPGGGPERLPQPWEMTAVSLSAINADQCDGAYENTNTALNKLGLLQYCAEDDVKVMHHVCRMVTHRAADIVSAACATLVRHIGRPELVVVFDGSMYRHLPGLSQLIEEKLTALCPETTLKLVMVHDGSGRGGALAAAMADRSMQSQLPSSTEESEEVLMSLPVSEEDLKLKNAHPKTSPSFHMARN